MITFVLQDDNGEYFRVYHPDWNHGCGGNEVTSRLDYAAVFRAELSGDKLEIVTPGPRLPERGNWTTRAVTLHLRDPS